MPDRRKGAKSRTLKALMVAIAFNGSVTIVELAYTIIFGTWITGAVAVWCALMTLSSVRAYRRGRYFETLAAIEEWATWPEDDHA